MPVFMVERDLKGITLDQLAGAPKAAIQTGKDMTAQGKAVLNDHAKIPYTRMVEALDLTP